MRPILALLLTASLLACTEEQSRPAKEVVAQVKSAADDAQRSAEAAARDAQQSASAASAEADRAARAVQQGVATAEERTRTGLDTVATGVREMGEGGVVTGRVHRLSSSRLDLSPDGKGPAVLRLDGRTRYLLQGSVDKAPLLVGTRVRATYVVEAHVPVATQVEVLGR